MLNPRFSNMVINLMKFLELLSDKDFDNLLDEGFVVDQEINET